MELAIPIDEFWRLPRHPDWKYEYWDGHAHLSYRPWPLRCVRPVAIPVEPTDGVDVAPLADADLPEVTELVVRVWPALDRYVTCASRAEAEAAVREDLERTLPSDAGDGTGYDVGVVARRQGVLAGAVTFDRPYPDLFEGRSGPVLSWLTVDHRYRGQGVARSLLSGAVAAAARAGAEHVLSAFASTNTPSLHWHLRHGFSVVPDPLRVAVVPGRWWPDQ